LFRNADKLVISEDFNPMKMAVHPPQRITPVVIAVAPNDNFGSRSLSLFYGRSLLWQTFNEGSLPHNPIGI
jgi:hypothetical protein